MFKDLEEVKEFVEKEFLRRVGEIVKGIEVAQKFKTVYSVDSAMTDLECAVMQLNTIYELITRAFYDEVINRLFKAYMLVSSAASYSKIQRVKGASTLLMECAREIKELIVLYSYLYERYLRVMSSEI